MDQPPIQSSAHRPPSDAAYQIAVILAALLLLATMSLL
jgi:hypothetical protein